MNGAATTGNDVSPMDPEYVDLLQECGLSRLAEETGPLEDVTGLEFMKMLKLSMDPRYQILWSARRVTKVETEEMLISRVGSRRCAKDKPTGDELAASFARDELAETPTTTNPPNSPITNRSPSPPPRTYRCETQKFQYFRFCFAGRDLPILSVRHYVPGIKRHIICCYGGYDAFGEMSYLSAPEYLALLHDETDSM
jgi:hypothetical protein